jgi:polar amino acid transport system substrate-binding protein
MQIRKISTVITASLIYWFSSGFFVYGDQVVTAADITYYSENYPPANYVENDKFIGVSMDTLRLMWKAMGVAEQKIIVVPWARGYKNTLQNKDSMLFTMARTADRENLFVWVGPIYTATHVLLSRTDFQHNINTIEDAFRYPVAAIRNDISEIALINTGFPQTNIAYLNDLNQAMQLLENGRLDLIIISENSIDPIIAENHFAREKFKIVLTVNQHNNYFAFNKDTSSKVIADFKRVFVQLAAERSLIRQRYGVD